MTMHYVRASYTSGCKPLWPTTNAEAAQDRFLADRWIHSGQLGQIEKEKSRPLSMSELRPVVFPVDNC